MKCVIFCVNYNSTEALKKYLDSINVAYLNSNGNIKLNVVAIDNSMNHEEIKKNYSFNFSWQIPKTNLGYFGGFAYGLKKYSKKLNDFDYIMISNVDLEMSKNFFDKLGGLVLDGDIGCIAPSIFSSKEKRDRNPKILERYSLKKLKMLCTMYKFPILYYFYSFLLYNRRRRPKESNKKKIIYGAHGSFMIFTEKFTSFLTTMDYPAFLFGEEIFVAENLKNSGLKTIYCPELVVYDSEHISTGRLKKRNYFRYNYDALKTMIKEFY